MIIETPCSSGDPEDWFIEKDGKQYRDEDPLTLEEGQAALAPLFENHGEPTEEQMQQALRAADVEKIKQALIRRRKAREACYTCPIRLACLAQRLETRIEYGIWGGHYPEQLRIIESERDRIAWRRSNRVQ